ncbi:condensation domain-containing protein [Pseudonocardia sp. HH130630-07]|uniref:condensation domain-containing protein n=1 Tax=Pseudonocardia sp. HH130630-07 TaxID=1690815 RepID=UPI000814EC17|nr:condensation domain-containing protein [Pseudonocardia sp. HH130630-07]ANY06008.1 hypothetical protein AFB00_06480 [Pseudonocardia sp. HH130630-07]
MIVGGDVLPGRNVVGEPVFWNAYGPTEAVVTALAHPAGGTTTDEPVPVGSPTGPRGALVVGAQGRPVERGVVGEIHLAGLLADGYLGDPAATADAFRPDPGAGDDAAPGDRVYHSGDLGVMAEDGTIRFVGRRDRQVKVRGYRVDPVEIEAAAAAAPGVRDARAVLVPPPSEDAASRLDCVVVPDPGATTAPTEAGVRATMAGILPAALLPSRVHVTDELPSTRSGKVDDESLRRRISGTTDGPGEGTTDGASAADGSGVAGIVHAALRSVLGPASPGIGFLSAGGDSLRALELCAVARRDGVLLDAAVALADGTAEDLIATAVPDPATAATGRQPDRSDLLPPAVHWFRERITSGPAPTWNMAVRIEFDELLHEADVQRAAHELVRVHPMLRARLEQAGAAPELRIGPADPVVTCSDTTEPDVEQALDRVFDTLTARVAMTSGTPIGFGVVRVPDRSRTIVLVVGHHFVTDVVSLQIVAADLREALARTGEPDFRLPAEHTSVHEWLTWLQARVGDGEEARRARAAYRGFRAGDDRPVIAPGTEGEAVTVRRAVPAGTVRHGCTALTAGTEELLQAAAATAWSEVTGAAVTVLEIETHGRALHADGIDLTRTVGWLTGLVPVPVHRATPAVQISEIRGRRAYLDRDGQTVAVLRHLTGTDPAPGTRPDIGVNYVGRLGSRADATARPHLSEGLRSPGLPRPVAVQIDAWFDDDEFVLLVEAGVPELAERIAASAVRCLEDATRSGTVPVRAGHVPVDLGGNDLQDLVAEFGEIEAVAPLTGVQEGMYLRSQADGRNAAYIEQIALGLPTGTDPERLRSAVDAAVARDPLLRGSVVWHGLNEPVVVTPRAPGRAVRTEHAGPDGLTGFAAEEVAAVAAGPGLLRAVVVGGADPALVLTVHHLAADGWSMRLLLDRIDAAYRDPGTVSSPVDLRAVEHMVVRAAEPGPAAAARDRRAPATVLPARLPGPSQGAADGNVDLTVLLGRDAATALRRTAAGNGVTLSTLVHTAWALVLAEPDGDPDRPHRVRFGSIAQQRPPGHDDAVGMYIEDRTVDVDVRPATELSALLTEVHAALRAVLGTGATGAAGPPYETAVIVDDARGASSAATFLGHPLDLRWSRERTGLALTLSVVDGGPASGIEITLNCDTTRADPTAARAVLDRCTEILTGLGRRDPIAADLWRASAPTPTTGTSR